MLGVILNHVKVEQRGWKANKRYICMKKGQMIACGFEFDTDDEFSEHLADELAKAGYGKLSMVEIAWRDHPGRMAEARERVQREHREQRKADDVMALRKAAEEAGVRSMEGAHFPEWETTERLINAIADRWEERDL